MTVDVDISESCAIGRVEKLGGSGEFNQDVGLGRPAPADIADFFHDRLVKRADAHSGLLQPGTQRFEAGSVLPFQDRQASEDLGRERRGGVRRCILNKAVERITDLLRTFDRGRNDILGLGCHTAPSSSLGARPKSRSLKSNPCGGRAMRTRRLCRFQRSAAS
jgi:hypothetical protein